MELETVTDPALKPPLRRVVRKDAGLPDATEDSMPNHERPSGQAATDRASSERLAEVPAGPLRDVPVDWEALEDAFENNAPEVHSYLHLVTGDVLRIVDGVADPQMHARIAADSNYLRIDPVSSREQYRWMERYIPMVEDADLQHKLTQAIDGKGAFRRFKDALLNYPVERERWFSYRSELLHWHIQEWFRRDELTSKEAPPWGEVPPPPDLDAPLPRPLPPSEGPGEALRRQARDLLEQVPAVELPAAITFLEFLRDRGSADLVRSRATPKRAVPA